MLSDVLALTLLQLSVGLVLFNALAPAGFLSGGFFALHGALALPVAIVAALVSGRQGLLLRPAPAPLSSAGLMAVFLVSLAFHTVLAKAGRLRAARVCLFPGAAAGTLLLTSRAFVAPFLGRGIGPFWLSAGLLLGGALFGAVVWTMNLGHWYLVSRSLPFQLLVRGSETLAALSVARLLFAVVALGLVALPSLGSAGVSMSTLLDPLRDGLFFWSRVLWGLLAPVALAPFVIKTARMRSNQAATGLLYVGVMFVMVGELLATYLTFRSGLPV